MSELITSRDNKIVKYVSRLLSSTKSRRGSFEFVIEGARLCLDAVLSSTEIVLLLYTKKAKIKYSEQFEKISKCANNSYVVSDEIMEYLSDTQSPQGILCICKMVDRKAELDRINNNGKFIALENVQDPSNMGTILRTAEALGINGIIISKDSCDIYNPKVLRGSMGAVFRIPIFIAENIAEKIAELNKNGFTSYASVPNRGVTNVNKTSFKAGSIIAIGNEGNGLATDTINVCTRTITIPMPGRAESLNAATAASIMMWEMVRGE